MNKETLKQRIVRFLASRSPFSGNPAILDMASSEFEESLKNFPREAVEYALLDFNQTQGERETLHPSRIVARIEEFLANKKRQIARPWLLSSSNGGWVTEKYLEFTRVKFRELGFEDTWSFVCSENYTSSEKEEIIEKIDKAYKDQQMEIEK